MSVPPIPEPAGPSASRARHFERSSGALAGANSVARLTIWTSVAAVCVLSVWARGAREAYVWGAVLAALAAGIVAARQRGPIGRLLGSGVAIDLASLGPYGQDRSLDICGSLGTMACAVAASMALTRVPSVAGAVRSPSVSPVAAVAAIVVVGCGALGARAAPAWPELAWIAEHGRLWDTACSALAVLVLLAEVQWVARRRGLEIGIIERTVAIRALLLTALMLATGLAVWGRGESVGLARLCVILASVLGSACAMYPDAVRVSQTARRVVVLTMVGSGAALLGASAVAVGANTWGATLVTAALALAIGSAGSALESPLRPAAGVWLDAFARAKEGATRAHPDDAIREVLLALRVPGGLSSPSPELWTSAAARAVTVDAAGYLHERDAELPLRVVSSAITEPEGTLRADALEALQVRRPDLRPLATWMADRGVWLAAVIGAAGESDGMLLLPRIRRREPFTLEEARALKAVADGLAPACRARSAQAIMLERSRSAKLQADDAEEVIARLRHERALDGGRAALATARLAASAAVGVYSTSARRVQDALEQCTAVGAPIAIVAPVGVDPVPYIARAHLAGARRDAPMVVIDGTSAREHDPARWGDATRSPLALADRGMLVLADGAALPVEVQRLVGRALAERRAPWERAGALNIQLAWTATSTPHALERAGRLDPSLAQRLGASRLAPIVLPRLRDRIEDLRSIVTERLAREGLRSIGRPVGIEPAAYARLIEHPFPGEEAELAVVVCRLVARCSGDVIRLADVDALRLSTTQGASQHSPGRRQSPGDVRKKNPLSA